MKNFTCWKKGAAEKIINPDVDAQPDAFFRAVHTSVPLRIKSQGQSKFETLTQDEFLENFLGGSNFSLVPIVGESGAGKSHLVRWMNLQIPQNENREVIFVPKARTNLRDIVKTLIQRLPIDLQKKYMDALQGTGTVSLSIPAQRTEILNNIQSGLKNDPGDDSSGIEHERESYLIDGLSDMFLDPYLRSERFLSDTAFAAELAAHVFEKPAGYKPAEQRREFYREDIPLNVENLQNAADTTAEFLGILLSSGDDWTNDSVAIVNRHIDGAIARCLNLSGDHLIELMLELRRELKERGKELILLIEDFARLQGLDRALLQSILEQGREGLCDLRTAFACTSGFYKTVADTVVTRLSFVVDMDNPLSSKPDGFNLEKMVARYMNAIRLGPDRLEEEWDSIKEGVASFEVDTACDNCEHSTICHATFGVIEGCGLYPFTQKALDVMAHRADEDVDDKFNARKFQNAVLRPTVALTNLIEEGKFPPISLLKDLGGLKRFPPDEQQKIKERDPEHTNQRLALISLWGGASKAVNLEDGIQTAFGLTQIDLEKLETKDKLVVEPTDGGDTILEPPKPVELEFVAELSNWANGEKLSAKTAQNLRELLFAALREFIDWDMIGCPRSVYVGVGKSFRGDSVYLYNQTTKRAPSAVSLQIPADWDDDKLRTNTYLALLGLLEAKAAGSWVIPDGAKKFACYQECLSIWAEEVTNQLKELMEGPEKWDPVCAALELRTLGVLLTTSLDTDQSKTDLLMLGAGEMGSVHEFASNPMKRMTETITENEELLSDAVKEGGSATKGGAPGKFINSVDLLEAMKQFKAREYTLMELPDESPDKPQRHKEVYSVAKKVHREFSPAFEEELKVRLEWLTRVETVGGKSDNPNLVSDELKNCIAKVASLGIQGSNDLLAAIQKFNGSNFSEALRSVRTLAKKENPRPWHYACDVSMSIEESDNLSKLASLFLDRAEKEIKARMGSKGYDPEESNELVQQLIDDMGDINHALGGWGSE
jgi:hypothetical protein